MLPIRPASHGAAILAMVRDTLLFWPLANLLLSVGMLLAGVGIAAWMLPTGFALALLVASGMQARRVPLDILATAILLLALLWVTVQLSVWMVDQNWDSRAYHGPAIIALRDGWNPLRITHVCDWQPVYCSLPYVTAIDHYPKASWLAGAQLYAWFGDLDAAKVPNILMLILTFMVAQSCVSRWLPLQRGTALLVSLVIAGNPVILAQLFSGYIDGLLAAALTCQILLLIDYLLLQERQSLWRAAALLPWLSNLKFTGWVYGSLFVIAFAVLQYWHNRRDLPALLKWQGSALVLSLALGFNPYISNWQDHGTPFHPVYQGGGSIIDQQAVPSFMAKNRFAQFLIATFSVQNGLNWGDPVLVPPLSRLVYTPMVESRFGAFGPLFSGAVLLAACLLIPLRRNIFGLFAGLVLLSIFITPAGWWARLAPQAWLAVTLIPLGICRLHTQGWWRELALVLLLILLLNNVLVMRSVYYMQYRASGFFHAAVQEAMRGEASIMPVTQWYGGEFGVYNRRKLDDSVRSRARQVVNCEPARGNRIFVFCQ